MTTFKQKILAKEIKRADAMKIRYQDLHVDPGFNLRTALDAMNAAERAEVEADNESLFQHIMSGGQLPALEVRPRPDGGVWLVDGHRRHEQIGRAIAAGAPLQDKDGEVWISIVPFEGNDADRVARIMTSQQNRKLTPLEIANGYARLRSFGWDNTRIAQKVGKTPQHVAQLLTLADANSDVQQIVAAGGVSATEAVKVVREHGENAGQVLADELGKAKAAGKAKVTAGTMKGKALPRKVVDAAVDTVDEFVGALSKESRIQLAELEKGSAMHETVSVNANALLALLKASNAVKEARTALEAKQREADEQAKQLDMGVGA